MRSTIRPETSENFQQLTPCKDPEAPGGDRYKSTCGIILIQNAHTNVATWFMSCMILAKHILFKAVQITGQPNLLFRWVITHVYPANIYTELLTSPQIFLRVDDILCGVGMFLMSLSTAEHGIACNFCLPTGEFATCSTLQNRQSSSLLYSARQKDVIASTYYSKL